jgi:sugar phosphate isomerase/epimerase
VKLAITSTPSQARFAPILHRGDPADAFALATEIGYQGVELHLRHPGDINAAAVKALIARTGLSVPTLGTGMAAAEDGLTFADDDPEVRQQAVSRIKEHISLAAELGAAVTIGLIWGRLGREAQRASRLAAATDCLHACCEAAAVHGVTLLFEALNRYESDYPNTVDDALAVIDTLGAANLKLLLDTFHMNIEEGKLAASVRRAGAAVGHVHLVDSNRQAPGHGHIDLRAVVRALARVGYSGFLAFEVLPLPSTLQAARDGYAVASKLLAGVS